MASSSNSSSMPEAEVKAGFFGLLEEHAVGSAASWAGTRDQVQHDPRYLAVKDEQRCAKAVGLSVALRSLHQRARHAIDGDLFKFGDACADCDDCAALLPALAGRICLMSTLPCRGGGRISLLSWHGTRGER